MLAWGTTMTMNLPILSNSRSNRNGGFLGLIQLKRNTWRADMTLAVSGLYSPFSPGYTMNHYQVSIQLLNFMIIPVIIGSLTWITGLCHWMLKRNPTNGNFASEASPSNSLSPSCNKINTSQVLANISQMWHQPNGCLKTGATKATSYQFSCLSASSLHLTWSFFWILMGFNEI